MDQDITEVLDAIAWAHRIVQTQDNQYVFRPLSLQDRNISNHIYNEALRRGKESGRKTKEELKREALKKGIWKAHFDNDIKLLKEELKISLEEETKLLKQAKGKKQLPSALITLQRRLTFVKSAIEQIEQVQYSTIELPSLEYYAEQERAHFAVAQATLCFPNMTRKWPSYNDLLNEEDTSLVHTLVNAYYRMEIADETTIRAAARSPVWRIKWAGSKKNGGVKTLFGREMYDLTLDQFRLVYWSQIYDSAFESMEPPTDEVVANDKLFDAWLDEQAEKRKQAKNKSALDKKVKDIQGQEVGMMVDGFYSTDCTCGVKEMKNARLHKHANSCPHGVFFYYKSDDQKKQKQIEQIQSANPEHVRRLLAKEQETIARKGTVAEQDLRGDNTRAVLGMPTKLIGQDGPKGRAR